ncbi:hypothetical protein ACUBJ7_07690 [Klebsiella pneumoniae]|uniref:hypothetical protein n=1 Tax=Klebsiella TaxID=570 RepID=UPI001559AF78|nr:MULTISPECIES: hypothetical protein [Klebsiella]MCU8824952.1 hypothetical protein [Klebsiella quasipneumoniae]MDE2552210.1 hypothetical protein [Klebsiella pneumoniae]MDV0625553.1 hypothetical protein [Klebsiella variicola subsp. variicola]
MRKKIAMLVISLCPQISHADTAPFTLSQVCQAGVATFYGRNAVIMKTQALPGDEVRVTYARPEDGRPFSFKCRNHPNSNSRLNLLDESLNGARWYGADLADRQTIYTVKDDVLIMRVIGNGVMLAENFYKPSSFSTAK